MGLVLGFVLAIVTPTTQAVASLNCQDNGVLVVYVMGSGATLGNDATGNGFLDRIRAKFGSQGVTSDVVRLGDPNYMPESAYGPLYPAAGPVNWVGVDFTRPQDGILAAYHDSRRKGTAELVRFLQARTALCPRETIVLAGHSQGADAIGAALQDPGMTPEVADQIGYVAQFGDPMFNSECTFGVMRSWVKGNSYCPLVPVLSPTPGGVLGSRSPYLPSNFVWRTGSWCDGSDGVCTGNRANLPTFPWSTHSNYPQLWMDACL